MIFPYKRLKKLYQLVSGNDQGWSWTTKALAERLEVTERTIRDDLKKLDSMLNEYGAYLESKRGSGYTIRVDDREKYHFFADESQEETEVSQRLPGAPEERIRYELFKLLNAREYVKMEDLADELYISRATMNNDSKIIRRILEDYSLTLRTKPGHGVKVIGEEKSIRYCLAEYADVRDEEGQRSDMPLEQQQLFQGLDLSQIRTIILKHLRSVGTKMADLALKDLITHLAVMVLRVKEGHGLERFEAVVGSPRDIELASAMLREMEEAFGITCPEGEFDYVLLHIVSKKMAETEWERLQSDRLFLAVRGMLTFVYERFTYDLRDDERLSKDLFVHLKPMLTRLEHGMNMRNPLLGHIRKYYPLAYEITVGAVKELQKSFPYDINDNEIGYLALHIGAALERKYNIPHRRRKTVLLVCGSGYGTARILESRLRSLFAELDVSRVVSLREYEEMSTVDEDLVVSTIHLQQRKDKPSAVISPIPSERDMETMTRMVRASDEEQETSLLRYFDKQWFMTRSDQPSKDSLIEEMSGILKQKGVVTDKFFPAVKEREKLGSTALDRGMAIPHPLELSSNRTVVSVCLLENPIPWDANHEVHVVFLLSICKEDYEQAMGIYDLFVELIRQEETLERLKHCHSFDAFMLIARQVLAVKSNDYH
ncbi:DeoR faimly transcriptional regulator [Paenibacillus peoriae]|uniref:BglG family transcription antiterminator n=1 Tax=Paenibacillus peoriae TaxID=59893 RepID=UPI0006A7275A|nr:BglG family transcription antiterminator [Paenibacillus peoriae]ALA40241.1 DeoR faimly transcriptional regulator [Paenibacillus peoriae]